jgi:hypothetical protein
MEPYMILPLTEVARQVAKISGGDRVVDRDSRRTSTMRMP